MKLRLALLCCALTMTACVNEGNKLERVRFASLSALGTALTQIDTYQCYPQLPTLIGEFTDGTLGDFTRRTGVSYSSSAPGIVQVSNGDILIGDGSGNKYDRGVLVPLTLGTATITASFAGQTTTVDVVVTAAGAPMLTQISTLATGGVHVAPDTFTALRATSLQGGRTINVTGAGFWTLKKTDDTDFPATVATIASGTGVVTGGRETASMPLAGKAVFTLPACTGTTASIPVTVAQLDHIRLDREYASGTQLLVSITPAFSTTEELHTIGVYADAAEQDLSFQSTIALAPTTGIGIGVTSNNLLQALGDRSTGATPAALSPVVATATVNSPADPATPFTASTEAISARNATLKTVTILEDDNATPLTATSTTVIAPFQTYQFHALGTFADVDDAATATQEITRDILSWTVSDTTVAFVGNSRTVVDEKDGLATSLKDADGCVTVTALTGVSDTTTTPGTPFLIQATTLLGIESATNPATALTVPCTPSTTPTS